MTRHHRAATTTAWVTLAAVAAFGCQDPYETSRRPPAAVPGEQPAPPIRRPADHVPGDPARRSPQTLARHAAELTGTWTGPTAAGRLQQLARLAIGPTRRQLEQAAARLGTDPLLTSPGSRSRAELHAVTVAGQTDSRRLLIVTQERLRADGLDQTAWKVTLARVRRQAGGWVLTSWEPQP